MHRTDDLRGSWQQADLELGYTIGVQSRLSKAATSVSGTSNLDVVSCPRTAHCEVAGANSNVIGSQEGVVVGSI